MNDPPDDPDRGSRGDADPDHDRREPHPNRRGTDVDRRVIDRHGVDVDRRATDHRGSGTVRERTDRRGTDAAGPSDAVVDRNGRDVASGRRSADAGALRWLSGVVSLVGFWIAASALVYETTTAALWNNLVVGVAIFLLAGYGFYRLARDRRPDVGSTSLAALLGLWAVASPFLLPYPSDAFVWSTVASGVAVAVLSGYNAYESRRSATTPTTGSRV